MKMYYVGGGLVPEVRDVDTARDTTVKWKGRWYRREGVYDSWKLTLEQAYQWKELQLEKQRKSAEDELTRTSALIARLRTLQLAQRCEDFRDLKPLTITKEML
jgi:hypothetical protein